MIAALQPRDDVDIAALFREDEAWGSLIEVSGPLFHPDFECVMMTGLQGPQRYSGTDGLRAGWLDWLAPWESYRTEIQEVVDAGADVVVVTRDYGRRPGMTAEVGLRGASVWRVEDGLIVRVSSYASPQQALEAVGLAE